MKYIAILLVVVLLACVGGVGWLYLNGQLSRVQELFETLWQSFDPNEK